MNRKDILHAADNCVSKDREAVYGDPRKNLSAIADLWNTYLAKKAGSSENYFTVKVDAYDVALMMALLKIARAAGRVDPDGSLIDLAGYAALAGETISDQKIPTSIQTPRPETTKMPGL